MSVLRSAAFAATGLALSLQAAADAGGGVSISSYGQRALFIQGGGQSVLLNPYKAVGCAAGLPEPRVKAGVVLASSELADEGARGIATGRFLVAPGSYKVGGLNLEGFASPHDRMEGRRFGNATIWRWQQGGLDFAHVGATAGPISGADRVLLGRPDVLIIGVGGGSKIYDGKEAAAVVKQLNPKRVIPVQYVNGDAPANCDQEGVQPFLEAMGGSTVVNPGRSIDLPANLPDTTVITVLR
ncbi:MBL fold metallo-hydrolase [Synechococcus sp. A15-28]|uniref:MBL fold metallo-hydrolase n=1 Tax=Synechococcus sp. A15-28 TaxID=1050638 RepID=UPI00164909D7|nr:MBL fold metallo-hydrolase [Synechococcus sp. A15-28]QNI43572.1 beta-lactamase superfamily domain protein [Synechococcus sp. A15-28]